MSKPSELREEIRLAGTLEHEVERGEDGISTYLVSPLPDEQIDAILDAILASLPELQTYKFHEQSPDKMVMLSDLKALLQSAKSNKDGE